MSNNGSFSDNPKTEWLVDPGSMDRDMKLLEDFWYIDPSGKKWLAPKGSIINGASIPASLWTAIGSPYTGDYRRASIVHDVACDDKTISRKDADNMFYYACLAGGCSYQQTYVLYAGVCLGTWASNSFLSDFFSVTSSQPLLKSKSVAAASYSARLSQPLTVAMEEPPPAATAEDMFLQSKFNDISNELLALPDGATPEDLDKIISKYIKL